MPCIERLRGVLSIKETLFSTMRGMLPSQLKEKIFRAKRVDQEVDIDRISSSHDGYDLMLDKIVDSQGQEEVVLWVGEQTDQNRKWQRIVTPELPDLHRFLKVKIEEENARVRQQAQIQQQNQRIRS